MDNKEFGKFLEERTKHFALDIIKLSKSLPNTVESNVIRNQITKSGTSTGANYREANRSRSKADFINNLKISEGETNETIYWIELIVAQKWSKQKFLGQLLKEASELLAIFTSVISKLKLKVL